MGAVSDPFTARELEILRLLAEGLSDREIAGQLFLTPGTIKWYNRQIYSKLGVASRAQAVVQAKRGGLLEKEGGETVHRSVTPQHNLPASITLFIGRSRELVQVRSLLKTVRLLTLTGVGGTGKTQLALRAASEMIFDFADGVYFVDLAPLSDAGLVAKAIAIALGVIENLAESQLDTLKRALAGREMLLFIDNFEHVITAAPMVSELLAAAPHLKVLVTSREALRLSGEQEFPVPPLSLPSADSLNDLAESEAASLFIQRVQMMLPGFEVTDDNALAIAQICTRLDGLPLAIELAAARCKLLSPQALLSRLDSRLTTLTGGSRDAPLRQQTLRQTLDWSYNLLDEGEKILFARLAVFSGGRSLEAIEAVCAQDLPIDLLDGLASLIDKNLIHQKEASGEPRFVMLETIHEYAREQLAQSGEMEAIHRRYAKYFVELAERAEPELRLAEHYRWSQQLELELHNLRAVLEWSLGEGDPVFGVRLAGALYHFWWAHGYHVEGYHWTRQLLERLEDAPAMYQAKFLFSAGGMAYFYDLSTARHLFMRMLDISRELGDSPLTGFALMFLGYTVLGETEAALATAEEGLSLFREIDYEPGIAMALNVVGEIARFGGDDDRAMQAYEECMLVAQQTGETRRILLTFQNLALLAHHKGDHARAIDLVREALHLACEMNNRLEMGRSLTILAGPLGARGQPERAARLLGASEAAFGNIGAFHVPSDKLEIDRILADVRAQLDKATFEAAWTEGRRMTLEQAVDYALQEQH